MISKAAFDAQHLYFFAQTNKPITPHTDPMWMLLLLDSDQDASTGWLGYDYVVNHEVISDSETTIKRWEDGGWQRVGTGTYQVKRQRLGTGCLS